MVDYVQPLALQALAQKKEPISATLKQGGAPCLVETADWCAGIEGRSLENLALPTHSLTVRQSSSLHLSIF